MRVVLVSLLVFCFGCSGLKSTATQAEINNLKEIIASKNIEAIFDWAQPMGLNNNVRGLENLLPPGSSTNNINLSGNANFFRIKNDGVHVDLPFYGQQQLSRGYNADAGIKFDGKPQAEKKYFDNKKGAYILKYTLNAKDEGYNATLTLYPNGNCSLNVNSSHRSTIYYNGNWKVLTENNNE
ncbi:DUF4251 domain-containing protein [Polaribacter sp. OB-PA-B3]